MEETIPEDVRKTAEAEALKFVEWLEPRPIWYEQAEDVLEASFARIILAERERRLPDAIDIFRTLKANRKRSYADIAHLIATSIRSGV
jgi:hypothetical protein